MLRIYKFSLYGVAGVAAAQALAGLGCPGIRVTCLYHESVYHTVEKRAVIISVLHQLEEIIAVGGGIAV